MEEKKGVTISAGMLVCLIIIALLVVIVIGFGMYIYFLKNSKIETSQPIADVENTEVEEPKKSIKIDETKEYVYEKDRTEINETIDYGGGETFDFTDTITLPFINIDSEDVKKINESLQQKYDKASTSLKREDEYGFDYTVMGYMSSLLEGKILSVETETSDIVVPGGDFLVDYKIYNIDLNTGKQLKNSEILEMCDVTEAQLDEFIKTSLESTYHNYKDDLYADSLEEFMATCEPNNYQIFVSTEKTLEVYIPCTGIMGGDSNVTYTMALVNKI